MAEKKQTRKELLKKKQTKTLKTMKKNREIDSKCLRDLIDKKLKWVVTEKQKGLDTIKNYNGKIQELQKAVLRLEGIELFIKDLLSPRAKKED